MTIHRRAFLSASAAFVALTISPKPFAWADLGDDVAEALRAAIDGREVTEGGIELDLPDIAANGASVPLGVIVESPMTADDHVRAIHVFATRNPYPPCRGSGGHRAGRIVRRHAAAPERLRRGVRRRLRHLSLREEETSCHAPASACPVPPTPAR